MASCTGLDVVPASPRARSTASCAAASSPMRDRANPSEAWSRDRSDSVPSPTSRIASDTMATDGPPGRPGICSASWKPMAASPARSAKPCSRAWWNASSQTRADGS